MISLYLALSSYESSSHIILEKPTIAFRGVRISWLIFDKKDDCIFANNATLAGHVHIGDWVIFGGLAAIHQFGRVGSHAFVAGMAALNKDVPPYVMAAGHYAKPFGVNSEGLKRRGFSPEAIAMVKRAYKLLYRQGLTVEEALPELETMAAEEPAVALFVDFLKQNERGIVR